MRAPGLLQPELQAKLAEALLPKTGNKADLIQRLLDAAHPPDSKG